MTIPSVIDGICQVSTTRGTKPVSIAYQLHGDNGGERVIFIIGRGGTRELWLEQAIFLSQKGYQVCIFDNRGIGLSGKDYGEFTMMDMVVDTVELLDHLGWTSNVHLVGMSLGGMLAQLLVLHYPTYFASSCFTSTTADSPQVYKTYKLALPPYLMDITECAKVLFSESWLDEPCKSNPDKCNLDWVIENEKHIHYPDTELLTKQTMICAYHVLTDEEFAKMRATNLPMLVCTGEDDSIIIPELSRHLADKLQVPLKQIKQCGHYVGNERPEIYNEILLEHFRNASSS
ncbi:Alpha/Beta hydrolase protein [Syncephalis plumigaleata]|nr:Alpha/Beta hydrolase protein [Syncephalis plumigaleata]